MVVQLVSGAMDRSHNLKKKKVKQYQQKQKFTNSMLEREKTQNHKGQEKTKEKNKEKSR